MLPVAIYFVLLYDRTKFMTASVKPGPGTLMMFFRGRKNLDAADVLFPGLERRQTCLGLLEPQLAMLPVDLLLLFDLISLCC